MTGRIDSSRPADIKQFMQDAADTVSTFRASVFDPFVRKHLESDGWEIEDFEQQPGHRPDFIARKDERSYRIAPRLVTSSRSQILARTTKRLKRSADEPVDVAGRILVVPDASSAKTGKPGTEPRVVRLADLLDALAS